MHRVYKLTKKRLGLFQSYLREFSERSPPHISSQFLCSFSDIVSLSLKLAQFWGFIFFEIFKNSQLRQQVSRIASGILNPCQPQLSSLLLGRMNLF